MGELVYLAMVVVISAVGSTVVWWRHRRPEQVDSGVKDFSRGLDALSKRSR